MYIHRIILRDVHNFDDLDITLYDDVWQKPLNSVLITGPNGSGKTTLLRIIADLWDSFGGWLRHSYVVSEVLEGNRVEPFELIFDPKGDILQNAGLVAIEIRELDNINKDFPNIWLFVTQVSQYRELLKDEIIGEKDLLFGWTRRETGGGSHLELGREYFGVTQITRKKELLERLGKYDDLLPNLVFLEAKNRDIVTQITETTNKVPTPEPYYVWFKSYDRSQDELEGLLRNVKLRNPEEFYKILAGINQFFGGKKRIIDFDNQLRLMIQVDNPKPTTHFLDKLSSGEQQCLIMMVMVSRWLMPGGVVLIDEPDLHLHVSLQRHFIHELEKIVHSRNGQLIVTSHSPEMWDEFTETQRRRLGVKEVMNG